MPVRTMSNAVSSNKDFNYFQRKKVGSIRDNPKLMKIRQRFEDASQKTTETKNSKSSYPDSAPCSLSYSRRTGSDVLEELLKTNSSYSNKTGVFVKNQLALRRHSEGEADRNSPLSVFVSKESKKGKNSSSFSNLRSNDSKLNDDNVGISNSSIDISRISSTNSSTKDIPTKLVDSATNDSNIQLSKAPFVVPNIPKRIDNNTQVFELVAPPIPKRGISPALKKNIASPLSLLSSSQNDFPSPSELSRIKSSPVKKTIQMYEGMSSVDAKKPKASKYASSQKTAKKDLSSGSFRTTGVYRRSSRRNSMKKSKYRADTKTEKTDVVSSSSNVENVEDCGRKEDSGFGSSDAEERNQPVYQTLSTVVRDGDDPYDRLNRVHDVNRVHMGEITSCAACKTIPPTVSQWPTDDENSFLHIKCHEIGPHHHPPCICFSCSHSVFSCSSNAEMLSLPEVVDTLYSNVCCLNSPDHEGWRQSRRRPVCERNGRLCVVNCDMEQRQMETCYDRLFEWDKAKSNECPRRKIHSSKTISGDSCDSDEGWVDVTDSEDEKTSMPVERLPVKESVENDNLYRNADTYLTIKNSAYDIDSLISKCMELDLSRCSSTEHLYETISDVETQNVNSIKEESSPDGSSTVSLKSEPTPENDLDSGEWSTESTSPTFDESTTVKNALQPKLADSSYQNRFAVHLDNQDPAKLNFMKSVLGKKST